MRGKEGRGGGGAGGATTSLLHKSSHVPQLVELEYSCCNSIVPVLRLDMHLTLHLNSVHFLIT